MTEQAETTTASLLSWVLDETYDAVVHHSADGVHIVIITLALTVLLEFCSLFELRKIWTEQRGGKSLYIKAVIYNVMNHVLIGAPTNGIAVKFLCRPQPQQLLWLPLASMIVTVIFVHSLLYYYFHKMYHESPTLYRTIHQFHHRFKEHVTPMVANAVTPMEYWSAYVMPIAIGAAIARPYPVALKYAILWMSTTNLLVHMPRFRAFSSRYVPRLFVSTADHLEHHEKVTTKYASPTFSIDFLVQQARVFRKTYIG